MAFTRPKPSIVRRSRHIAATLFAAWLIASLGSDTIRAAASDAPRPKKIVLIAGQPDDHPPTTHEYAQSIRLLRRCLATSSLAPQIRVETHFDGWPEDESTLADADTIVLIASGSDHVETNHPLFVGNRLLTIEKQMQRGCGLVALHYSTFAPNHLGARILEWLGGYFDYQSGPDKGWFSKIQHWDAELKPAAPDHPICRGVHPFQMKEELYYNLRFIPDDPRRTAILLTRPPNETTDQAVAWAVERKEGGRGFGFTGGHHFDSWHDDDFRRLVLNAIAWSAHVEVPPGGVDSEVGNQPEKIRATIVTGHQYPGHLWRETTEALKETLRKDPWLSVETVSDIEFLASADLHRSDLVVLNYCNWEKPGLSDAAKTNFMRFLRSGGGLVIIHFANGAFHFSLPGTPPSDWPEWRTQICRRVWDHTLEPATGQMKSGHDSYGPFQVDIASQNHPVTQGLTSFATRDELYFHQQGNAPVHLLATAHSKVTGKDEPIAFDYRYGAGRVFQTFLGHDAPALRSPGTAQLVRRASVWVAGADPGKAEPIEPSGVAAVDSPAAGNASQAPGDAFGEALDARRGAVEVKANLAYQQPPRSVELWARLDSSDGFNVLIAQSVKESSEHWELFTENGTGHLAAFLPGYAPNHVRSSIAITDGRWHALAMTFDGEHLQLFVDGRQAADVALTRRAEAATPGPLWIGGYPPGSLGCKGLIDEVRLSSGTRQIDGVPDRPLGSDENTVGLWHFDVKKTDRHADASRLRAVAGPVTAKAEQATEDYPDDRWPLMDTGRIFSGTLRSKDQITHKAIAIRVGERKQAAWMFDTELLRFSCAWADKFISFDARRFGLGAPPRVAGSERFRTPLAPGWAQDGSFDDPRQPKPLGPLPRAWAHYRGLYRHGDRVTLAYSVDDVEILDSPWLEIAAEQELLTRTLQVAANRTRLDSVIALMPGDCQPREPATGKASQAVAAWQRDGQIWAVALLGGAAGDSLRLDDERRAVLLLPAQSLARRLKLIFWTGPEQAWNRFETAVASAAAPEDLQPLLLPGPKQWTADIVTRGRCGTEQQAYVVDTLTLPFDNPYHSLMFVSGFDFFSDGSAVVSTLHGDVWRVRGIDAGLERLEWKRFATGLFQPLGVKTVDDRLYVVGRDQITQLHDANGDDEADLYENFNNDGEVTDSMHEFAACLETDPEGNFYYLRCDSGGKSRQDGCLLRVARDGSQLDVFATGFRNANGLGIGPQGLITVAPQQGTWTPGSAIFAVREGGFYGMMDVHHRAEKPTTYDPPLCWIPRPFDNSSGGQVWATTSAWGPLENHLLHLSYGRSSMMLVLAENVDGQEQGAVVPLPLAFESGVMRGRVRAADGQVYVGGLNGWQTNAARDGCLQRIRYTGAPCDLPVELHYVDGGVLLRFSRPLDRIAAEGPSNYDVQVWNYLWSGAYGSPDFKVSQPKVEGHDELAVASVTLQSDERTIFIAIPDIKPVMQIALRFALRSADGTPFESAVYGTIHALGPRPTDLQVNAASERPDQLDPEQVAALAPGLKVRFSAAAGGSPAHDTRALRLPAWHVPAGKTPASFLPPGPFTAVAEGYLRADMKGNYRFSLAGQGIATLVINGSTIFADQNLSATGDTSNDVLLLKGHNRLKLNYASPPAGDATLRLLWSGAQFEPELLPATALFHDGADAELQAAREARVGLDLFAAHRCAKCHALPPGLAAGSMPHLLSDAPSLAGVGSRLRPAWVEAWLVDPRSLCDDATMPRLLHDRPGLTNREQAADIAAYLATLGAPAAVVPPAPNDQQVSQGEALYEELGCIQCHRFTPPAAADEFGRTSLEFVGDKFQPGALEDYLAHPHANYAWSRMPDFHPSASEAAALAEFIRSAATANIPETAAKDSSAARGRELFQTSGCNQCHRVDAAVPAGPPNRQDVWQSDAAGGCLADEPSVGSQPPDYRLSGGDRKSLRAFLRLGADNLAHSAPAEVSERLFARLRCAACHGRDGRSTRAAEVLDLDGTQGLAPEQLPPLDWAGEKLQSGWTERLLAGTLGYRSRPWLKARMPAFAAWAPAIAQGLACEHGVASDDRRPADDPKMIEAGRQLTLRGIGLDCRQCHSLTNVTQKQENNAQGISFLHTAERLRYDYYRRWMLDPLRIDPQSKMLRFATDRRHTASSILDADARRQFDALWQYIQTVPESAQAESAATGAAAGTQNSATPPIQE